MHAAASKLCDCPGVRAWEHSSHILMSATSAVSTVAITVECNVLGVWTASHGDVSRRLVEITLMAGHGDTHLAMASGWTTVAASTTNGPATPLASIVIAV